LWVVLDFVRLEQCIHQLVLAFDDLDDIEACRIELLADVLLVATLERGGSGLSRARRAELQEGLSETH